MIHARPVMGRQMGTVQTCLMERKTMIMAALTNAGHVIVVLVKIFRLEKTRMKSVMSMNVQQVTVITDNVVF